MYRFQKDFKVRPPRPDAERRIPDLASQFEALLDAVWAAEANWRFDDRLDRALGVRHAA